MADKMMRISGRDKSGKARAIATNENGEVLTRLTGSYVEEITLFDNTQGVIRNHNGLEIDVTNFSHLLLDVKVGSTNFVLKPEVKSGEEWIQISALGYHSDLEIDAIVTTGLFLVDVRAWESFRLRADVIYDSLTVKARGMVLTETPKRKEVSVTYPSPIRPNATLYNRPPVGASGLFVTPDGIIYGSAGPFLRKYPDGAGERGVTIHQFTGDTHPDVLGVYKTEPGNLVVLVENKDAGFGEIWRSDEMEENFVKVHTFESPGARAFQRYSDMWGKMLLVGEYNTNYNANKIYMSVDYGATWDKIFEETEIPLNSYHIHDVKYDPYDDIIWVCTGDNKESSWVYYTTDRGKNWVRVPGSNAVQYTSITPMPDCILFGSDARYVGITRLDRKNLKDSKRTKDLQFEPVYTLSLDWLSAAMVVFFAGVVNKDGVAYFGFREVQQMPPQYNMPLIATADGYNFYTIWSAGKAGGRTQALQPLGVTDDKKIVCTIQGTADEITVDDAHILIVDEPEWKKR